MGLLSGGLFVGLGVALLRRTGLAPFSGWWMYVDASQEKGNGGICCSREQPNGRPPFFGFLGGPGYVCVVGRTCLRFAGRLPDCCRVVDAWFLGRPSLTVAALLTH